MKKLLLIFLLIPIIAFPQYKEKYKFRELPRVSETICITGLGMMVMSATVLHTECEPKTEKIVGYIGGLLCFTGVILDLNTRKQSFKYKHKRKIKGRLFGSYNFIGINLRF